MGGFSRAIFALSERSICKSPQKLIRIQSILGLYQLPVGFV